MSVRFFERIHEERFKNLFVSFDISDILEIKFISRQRNLLIFSHG